MCRVLLIGMMGSGKTTVGRLLARRLGWPYHDNDALLRQDEGMTARRILAAGGDADLLAAEVGALRRALEAPLPCVVGVAGRVILDAGARRAIEAGIGVWLRVRPETIRDRAAGASHRPWPAGDPMDWIRTTLAVRQPLYASVADLTLDADTTSPTELVEAIAVHLADRGCR